VSSPEDEEPTSISEHVEALLRSLHAPSRTSLSGVFGRWDAVVGPALAAHVRPVRLDGGVLTVEVNDPAWATQVTFLGDEMRARLAADVGVQVERIEVRVRPAGRR
jgi:predicted nucleic acid-binding Zn ribbon protein